MAGSVSMTGVEFQELSLMEQASAAAQINVFARVEPSHKSLLVTRLKEQVCLRGASLFCNTAVPDMHCSALGNAPSSRSMCGVQKHSLLERQQAKEISGCLSSLAQALPVNILMTA